MAGPRISTFTVIWRSGAAQYSILAATPACWRRRWPGNRIVSSSASILPRRCSPWRKRRCGGASVSRVLDDARKARLNRRFDLVLLTGHAFLPDSRPGNCSHNHRYSPLAQRSLYICLAQPHWRSLEDMDARSITTGHRAPAGRPGRRVERHVARSNLGHCHVSNLLADHRGRPGPLLPVANRVSIARTALLIEKAGLEVERWMATGPERQGAHKRPRSSRLVDFDSEVIR